MSNITSLPFLAFISIIILIYYLIPNKKYQWFILLISSLIFYCNSQSVIYILLTSLLTYLVTLTFNIIKNKTIKKILLLIDILFPISILIILKYNLFNQSIVIPLGISYYTLSIISYVVDSYKKEITNKSFLKYFTSIIYFPVLIQGPITRFKELKEDLFSPHKFNISKFKEGTTRIVWGFFKQLLIASRLQIIINYFVDNNLNGGFTIITLLLYSILIYTNFSAGIDIVIGFSKILQINLTENFNTPYFSKSLNEFWKRWHISLTNWYRTYIYIPLGGNRCSKYRHYLNILIVFILSGMWHGSTINFFLWGLFNGIIMVIERIFKFNPKNNIFILSNFIIISFLWIFFVYSDINIVLSNFISIFNINNYNLNINYLEIMDIANYIVLLISIIILIIVEYLKFKNYSFEFKNTNKDYILLIILVLVIILFGNYGTLFDETEFIYNGW